MMSYFLSVCLAAVCCLGVSTAAADRRLLKQTCSPVTNDKLFEQGLLNSDERTVCSPPAPGIAWRGVAIRAPAQVALPGKQGEPAILVIPLCGLYSVDVAAAVRHPGPKMLVIKDASPA